MSATVYYRLSADASLDYRRNGRSQSSPPAFSSNEIPFPVSASCYSAKLNLDAIALPPSTANPADLPVVERSELARVLDLADHEPLFDALRAHNRTGRPPFDVRAMWRATLSKYLLGIDYNVELVAQLRSDAYLRDVCGFGGDSPSPSTPNESVVCRFYKRLTAHQDLVDDAVRILVDRLAEAIDESRKPDDPKPGRVMAIDSTDIETFADVRLKPSTDPDAMWGHRTPKNAVNKAEDKGKKDEFFFGFKMHAVCDANWGFPLGWIMLPANRSDSPTLPGLVDQVITQHPHLKPEYFIGDRGYDAYTNYRHLEDNRIWAVKGVDKTYHCGGGMLYHLGDA